MAGHVEEVDDKERDRLVAEVNRLLDAIALHRREHVGGQYSDRDRKLYAAIGFAPPAPASEHRSEVRKPK